MDGRAPRHSLTEGKTEPDLRLLNRDDLQVGASISNCQPRPLAMAAGSPGGSRYPGRHDEGPPFQSTGLETVGEDPQPKLPGPDLRRRWSARKRLVGPDRDEIPGFVVGLALSVVTRNPG